MKDPKTTVPDLLKPRPPEWLRVRDHIIRSSSVRGIFLQEFPGDVRIRGWGGWVVYIRFFNEPAQVIYLGRYAEKKDAQHTRNAFHKYQTGITGRDEWEKARAQNCLDMEFFDN